ncbi:MAG: redoxin domain-containing protein [Urechidicola sp.]|nr:redoxin domain-containing protein [Urechidicola sp.]
MKNLRNIVSFIFLMTLFISCKPSQQTIVKATEEIPYFTFYTLDQQRFVKDSFDSERVKFIMYFNSECDHCQKQARWLRKGLQENSTSFKDLEMIFISFEEMSMIKEYRDKYQFTQSNITFLQDSRLTFADKFGVGSFPSILIYSKEGKLIKKFEGETKIEEVLPFISN